MWTFFGYLFCSFLSYKFLKTIYNIVYPYWIASPIQNLVSIGGGKWAVVTGSTDGIGKQYALELAKRGFNIILVSRTQKKLDDVKLEIESKYAMRQVMIISYDFTDSEVENYKRKIQERLEGLDVGVLVNNVGMSFQYPSKLAEMPGGLEEIADIVVINSLPVTLMTAIILPQMVERSRGIVINISSGCSYNPMALWSVYSSTKKYVDWFTECLRLEYENHKGLIIQTVNPMLVATKMSKVRKSSFFVPTAEKFAQSALNTVGIMLETNGYFSHQIQGEFVRQLPACILNPLLTKESLTMRHKALRKQQNEAKND